MNEHLEFLILLAIENTPAAMDKVHACQEELAHTFRSTRRERWAPTAETISGFIARYVFMAIDWNLNVEPYVLGETGGGDGSRAEDAGLTRRRISLVQQLLYTHKQMTDKKARLRSDRPITPDVMVALAKGGALGSGVLSYIREQNADWESYLGVFAGDGEGVFEKHSHANLARHDPFHLNEDARLTARNIHRHMTQEERAGRLGILQADAIESELLSEVWEVLAMAERFSSKQSPSLKDVKTRLSEEGKSSLGKCALAAARSLQVEFGMLDFSTQNQSSETVASWIRPYPLAQFVLDVFDVISPITPLEEAEVSGQTALYDLGDNATIIAATWARYARQVLSDIAGQIDALGIQIDRERLNDADGDDEEVDLEDIKVLAKRHYLDCGSRVMEKSEGKRREHGRMATGRNRIMRELWQLRDDAVKLLGFTELMYLYHRRLLDAGSPLLADFTRDVLNPVRAWHKELMAQYRDGAVFPQELKRRASGRAVEVPDLPRELRQHQLSIIPSRNGGFAYARRSDVVIDSLFNAIDEAKHVLMGSGRALETWREASRFVDERWPGVY